LFWLRFNEKFGEVLTPKYLFWARFLIYRGAEIFCWTWPNPSVFIRKNSFIAAFNNRREFVSQSRLFRQIAALNLLKK